MVEKVSGYLASDGTFFENEDLCESHEAETELRKVCLSERYNPEDIVPFIKQNAKVIERFCKSQLRGIENFEAEIERRRTEAASA